MGRKTFAFLIFFIVGELLPLEHAKSSTEASSGPIPGSSTSTWVGAVDRLYFKGSDQVFLSF